MALQRHPHQDGTSSSSSQADLPAWLARWPHRDAQVARLAKLLAHAGQIDEAMDAWQRARRVLAVTHGESAPLVRTLDADLADAMMARGMHEEATPEDLD